METKKTNDDFADVPRLLKNYTIKQNIGNGVYGNVYEAKHIKTHQKVAIKKIELTEHSMHR